MTDFIALDLAPAAPELEDATTPIESVQSPTEIIRAGLQAKVLALPFFAGFFTRASKQLPSQPYQLPFLGVFLGQEDMTCDGDPGASVPHFIHRVQIGFQVIIANNDPVRSQYLLDQAYWMITNGLMTDARLLNFVQSDLPDNTRLEGFDGGKRKHEFGNAAQSNETPIAILEYTLTVRYRSRFEPIITDDLLRIHEESVPRPNDGDVPGADEVVRVITEYQFDPATRVKGFAQRAVARARDRRRPGG